MLLQVMTPRCLPIVTFCFVGDEYIREFLQVFRRMPEVRNEHNFAGHSAFNIQQTVLHTVAANGQSDEDIRITLSNGLTFLSQPLADFFQAHQA